MKQLERGRAHIEERGHGLSPLFVYEDGGAMELALMRLVDGRLVAVAEAALPETSTKHLDVCGTIDELKELWEKRPGLADTEPERLEALLDHAMGMLRRIEQRMEEYGVFAEAISRCATAMAELQHPDHAPGPGLRVQISATLQQGSGAVTSRLSELFEAAEAIRTIAGDSEQVLYRYRDIAIEIGALYEEIRGAREWQPPQPS